jgi:hypothetical protein
MKIKSVLPVGNVKTEIHSRTGRSDNYSDHSWEQAPVVEELRWCPYIGVTMVRGVTTYSITLAWSDTPTETSC